MQHHFDEIRLPERVAASLRALGATGETWSAGLPALLAGLRADWSVSVGRTLEGGRAAYVAEAVTDDGTPVVLKVSIPTGTDEFARQVTALRLGDGDPYVTLLRHDVPRRALLLERLGRPMADLGWPAARQLDALARTAAHGWRPVPEGSGLPTGAEAARWHADFIPSTWEALGRPCPEGVVELAVRYATEREAAFDAERAVLVHGDVHAFNALKASGAGFRLVDPGGLASEPEHDLGVILARGVREWSEQLAGCDPRRAQDLMARACLRTGADPEAVRQWAYVELVSTGLFLSRGGQQSDAALYLTVAGKLLARPRLLLMVGLPGAGKTTRAEELAVAHRALRLTPDEWMIALFGEPDADGRRDILEAQLITLALRALRSGTDVVLDFGLWGRDERSALRRLAATAGADCEVVYLPVADDVQRARITHRQATAPHTTFPMAEADITDWRGRFQEPDATELAGGAIPEPPPGWPTWSAWAADRWPTLQDGPCR